jgi:putative ABC transport system permease protein
VLFVSLRDLQWRRRRFLISVLATGLVFALALLISGISASFHNEVGRAVRAFHADEWLVAQTSTGPFTSSALFGDSAAADVKAQNPDVTAASPIAILRFTVQTSRLRDINVIGVVPNSIGMPKLADGRPAENAGEVLADRSLNVPVGRRLVIGGKPFTVVGRTNGVSYFAGTPTVFMTLKDAQALSLGSQPLASAIVVRGHVTTPPAGLHTLTNEAAIKDLRRPLQSASGTVDILRVLLWLVAAGIIGSVLYLQAIERTRDFAVFKATGVTGRSLAGGLALQAVILAISAALVAIVMALLLGPLMPMNVETPGSTFIVLPVVAVIVGLLASVSGLRRAVGVDPALAFGGA